MLSAGEKNLLCRVEGDAPMGHIMRRHWLDLVAFHDSDGRPGVVRKTGDWRTLGVTPEELAECPVGRAGE
jgi:hypothetical protein